MDQHSKTRDQYDFFTEIYDTKTENVRVRSTHALIKCDECGAWCGHEITCSRVTVESIARLLKIARKNEESIRQKAARWLEQLQRATGKIAILQHENNKLRNKLFRTK